MQQLARLLARNRANSVLAVGMFEQQETMLAFRIGFEHDAGEQRRPVGQDRFLKVRINAVAIEMHGAIRPSGLASVGATE